ncbi:hypothetical protein HYPSUDRAFT_208881 [Hypholoma sublateritium FD-334 SS-4]|uniref:Uncharacterized protein n=1 Tax=Hypholoma sublateritium (strain FD-334 SS-4) TaxID=945553 RepID=A0A0D2P0P5_HYPSF|nr:hypothetical protein HYPSUDRAFT_208881 [Hypholoma sublateritium FD-334 SS-4]
MRPRPHNSARTRPPLVRMRPPPVRMRPPPARCTVAAAVPLVVSAVRCCVCALHPPPTSLLAVRHARSSSELAVPSALPPSSPPIYMKSVTEQILPFPP